LSYTLPTFNLVCSINTFSAMTGLTTFRLTSPCNLAMGKRSARPASLTGPYPNTGEGFTASLLLPPLTDVRDGSCSNEPDIIEVPQGSGRYYVALLVDDIGKGFPNEHRFVSLYKTWPFPGNPWTAAPFWPTPIT